VSQSEESIESTRPVGIRASASFFPELESLRGWAILLVFFFHADGAVTGDGRIGTTVSPLLAFMTAGHTGVTLFFILSAFLLARPFLEEGRGGRRVARSSFYRRRVLRIMPLYAAAVVAAVAFSYNNVGAVLDGLRAVFFLNSFTGSVASLMPYSAVWWSLATEVQFYLVLPLLGVSLRSRIGRMIGVAVLLAWAIAYAVLASDASLLSGGARFRLNLSLPGRAPAFLFGITAAWIVLRYGEQIRTALRKQAWLRNGGSDLLLLGSLFALGLLLQKVTYRGFIPSAITMPAWHLPESLLWTMVLLLVVLAPLRMRSVISNRVMGILGLLSYSLYLIHEPVVFFGLGPLVQRGVPLDIDVLLRIAAFAIAFTICVALSVVTYRLIERPFLVRKARIDR
jgi:peptidoglycan/LPS O-acetylase OafA/YrhL